MNHRDPVVEAVRASHETHAARFGFHVRAICRDLRERHAESGRRIIHAEPKRQPEESDPEVNGVQPALARPDRTASRR